MCGACIAAGNSYLSFNDVEPSGSVGTATVLTGDAGCTRT